MNVKMIPHADQRQHIPTHYIFSHEPIYLYIHVTVFLITLYIRIAIIK